MKRVYFTLQAHDHRHQYGQLQIYFSMPPYAVPRDLGSVASCGLGPKSVDQRLDTCFDNSLRGSVPTSSTEIQLLVTLVS